MARLLIAAAILLFILGSNTLPTATAATTIGVSYSAETAATYSTNPPIPARVASTVSSMCLTSLRMDNMADPTLIGAFVDSNTSLLLTIPNELVQSLGANRSNALRWLTAHVVPFFPRTKISTISVGNQYLQDYPEFAEYLLPAIDPRASDSEDTSAETVVHSPRNIKKSFRRKHPKSLSSPLKKNQQKRSSCLSPAKSNKVLAYYN